MDLSTLWLAIVAFGAALVNGGIGYGFSSLVTPIAVLWYPNQILNPAVVVVEVGVNLCMLYRERRFFRAVWPRVRPMVSTLFPGVVLGTFGLAYLAVNDVKFVVYAALFPLIALQLLGFGRRVRDERRGGAVLGPGIGFLYSLTTISGPPLALFLRNQGLSKNEFRCAIAQIRVAESTLTLSTYLAFGTFFSPKLVSLPSLGLLPSLVAPVVLGVPLGAFALSRLSRDSFRQLVMLADGIVISYGLSRILVSSGWVSADVGYLLLVALLVALAGLGWFAFRAADVVGPRLIPLDEREDGPGGGSSPS